jgi:hypothetical protein
MRKWFNGLPEKTQKRIASGLAGLAVTFTILLLFCVIVLIVMAVSFFEWG